MDKSKALKANKEAVDLQKKINDQWHKFATVFGREAYADLLAYADAQREMYIKYCEDLAIPHPTLPDQVVPIEPATVAALLQSSRGINIMRTYITKRVNANGGVAQPTTK